MKEGTVDRERAVVAHDQAPEVTEPGVGAFDNPASAVAPQRSAVLGRRFLSVAAMWPRSIRYLAAATVLRKGSLS